MSEQKLDRRVRKTRALLQEKLILLMREKDIKDISVKELSDMADINRGTFYLHYTDVYDMLHQLEQELFQEFNQILDRNMNLDAPLSPYTVLVDIFTYLDKHKDLARVMMGPHGDLAFINHMKALVRERLKHLLPAKTAQTARPEYIYSYIISGYIGVIESWLADEHPCCPNEVAALCNDFIETWLNG